VVPPVYKCQPKDSTPLGMVGWAQQEQNEDSRYMYLQYPSCMAASLPAGHSYSLTGVEDPLLDLEAELESARPSASTRRHGLPIH
jgi:hypothetical protein